MPTIDELVLKIVIDANGAKVGAEEVKDQLHKTRDDAQKTGRETDRAGEGAAQFYLRIGKAAEQAKPKIEDFGKVLAGLGMGVAGTVTAIIAALKGFDTIADKVTEPLFNRQMEAVRSGMSIKEQSIWDQFAKQYGSGTEDEASKAYLKMMQDFAQFSSTGGQIDKYAPFMIMGVKPAEEVNGHTVMRSFSDITQDFRRRILEMSRSGVDAEGHSLGGTPRDWTQKLENMLERAGYGKGMAVGLLSNDYDKVIGRQRRIAPNSNDLLNQDAIRNQRERMVLGEQTGQAWNDLLAPWIKEETKLLATLNAFLEKWRGERKEEQAADERASDPTTAEGQALHKSRGERFLDWIKDAYAKGRINEETGAKEKQLRMDYFGQIYQLDHVKNLTEAQYHARRKKIEDDYQQIFDYYEQLNKEKKEQIMQRRKESDLTPPAPAESNKQTSVVTGDIHLHIPSGDPRKIAGAFHRELESLVRSADSGVRLG